MNEKQVIQGITNSFDFWLSQRDITIPACIEDGIKQAFTAWLDANAEQIIAVIGKQAARAIQQQPIP